MIPDFRIVVDGHQVVTAAIRERLLGLRVSDEAGQRSDTVEIRLDNRGGLVKPPRRGAVLQVELGYSAGGELAGLEKDSVRVPMGRYTVDEVELSGPPDTLAIRAKAADMRSTMKQRRSRSWRRVLLGDLIETIAAHYGLDPRVSEALAKIVLPHVDQTDESDLHLLTRLAEQYGAVAKPGNGRLVFAPRGAAMSAASGPVTAVRIVRGQAADYRVTIADRPGYRSVRAYWYDTAAGRRMEVTAGGGEPVYALRDNHAGEAAAARPLRRTSTPSAHRRSQPDPQAGRAHLELERLPQSRQRPLDRSTTRSAATPPGSRPKDRSAGLARRHFSPCARRSA